MKRLRTQWAVAACVACAASACRDSGPASSWPFSPEAGKPAAFADVFEIVDTLALEGGAAGNAGVLFARFDGRCFTVAAPEARQVSVYAMDGSLVADRRGFVEPVSARPTQDGLLLVADMSRRLILMAEDAATEPEVTTIRVVPFDALDLGDQRYLVTGVPFASLAGAGTRPPYLHVWNAMSKTFERSFFSPPRLAHLDDVASKGEWASAAVRGDTIWAVSQFSDSIFVFGTDGSRIGSAPLPLAALEEPETPDGAATAPLWSVDAVHLLAGGRIVVQLGDQAAMDDPNETRYLVIVGVEGVARAVLAGTSVLRVVAGDVLYFEDLSGSEAGRWVATRLRENP